MFLSRRQRSSKRSAELTIELTRKLLTEDGQVKERAQEFGSYPRIVGLLDRLYAAPVVRGGLKIPRSERKAQKIVVAIAPPGALKTNTYVASLDPGQLEQAKRNMSLWEYAGDSYQQREAKEEAVLTAMKWALRLMARKTRYLVNAVPRRSYTAVAFVSVQAGDWLFKRFKNPPPSAVLRARPVILLPVDARADAWPTLLIYSLSIADDILERPLITDDEQYTYLEEMITAIHVAGFFEDALYRSDHPVYHQNSGLLLFSDTSSALMAARQETQELAAYRKKVTKILADAGMNPAHPGSWPASGAKNVTDDPERS